MKALLVISTEQAKKLIAVAIAKRLENTTKRVYMSYGSTNQLILDELGIKVDKYYNGFIAGNELCSNKDKPPIIILNNDDSFFQVKHDDIIIKGANALSYVNGEYKASVAVGSHEGGTYLNVVMKASCVGADVLIPVSHEKLVPSLYNGVYTQDSFDISMGSPISLFEYQYGEVFTEIDAFKELYDLDAHIYIKGGINNEKTYITFVVDGEENSIIEAKKYILNGGDIDE